MARRSLSGLLLSIAMLLGSLAWTGVTLQNTVFDASRTGDIVAVLLDSETVNHALLQRVVSATDGAMSEELRAQVSLEELTTAATGTLEDLGVQAAVQQAAVDTHKYLIGETDQPPTVDPALLDAVVRDRLVAVRPDLAAALPEIKPIALELPTAGLAPIRAARNATLSLTPGLAMAALIAAVGAVLISPDRQRTLTRLGIWSMSLGALWIVLRFVVPAASQQVFGDAGAFLAGLSEAASTSMTNSGLLMFGVGIALMGAGFLVGALERSSARDAAVARAQTRTTDWSNRRPMRREPRTDPTSARPSPAVGAVFERAPIEDDPRTYQPPRPQRLGEPVRPTAAGSGDGGPAPAPPVMPEPPLHTAAGPSRATAAADDDWADNPLGPRREFRDRSGEDRTGGSATDDVRFGDGFDAPVVPLAPAPPAPTAGGIPLPDPAFASDQSRHAPNEWLGGFSMDPRDHDRLASPAPAAPRWVEGVGYVYAEPPTPGARWIEGLGYAIDEG
jgi:hypothetical protein